MKLHEDGQNHEDKLLESCARQAREAKIQITLDPDPRHPSLDDHKTNHHQMEQQEKTLMG